MASINKQKIFTNALFLYIRTFGVVVITLYSSRILLQELGAEDFGLYSLTGSIVAVFTSLRVVFASATQRFLNFGRANLNINHLRNIFFISKRLHLILCIAFFIIVEFCGSWLLNEHLNIPTGKLYEANIVLQLSILTVLVTIMTVPYDAVIISNEKFDIYAYLAILECLLQLISAFVIICIPNKKLIWYTVLILMSAIIIRIINLMYCRRTFEECQGKGSFDKILFKNMGKFAGWNFLGNFSLSLYNEGINMLLNVFGGVIANAARGISGQVLKGVCSVSDKLVSAFTPQTVYQYAIGQKQEFNDLIIFSTKILSYLYICLATPIICFTDFVLQTWLGRIPEYSIVFVRSILVYGFIRTVHSPIDLCFKSYGDLRKYQIVEMCFLLPSILFAYIFLKIGLPLYSAFIAMIICNTLNIVAIIILANNQMAFPIVFYLRHAIIPIIRVLLFISVFSVLTLYKISNLYAQIFVVGFIICISIYILGLNYTERKKIRIFLCKK